MRHTGPAIRPHDQNRSPELLSDAVIMELLSDAIVLDAKRRAQPGI